MRSGRRVPPGVGALLLLAAAVALAAMPPPPRAPTFEAAERARLDRGDLLLRVGKPPDGAGIAVEAAGLVDAPPARVWAAIRDCERYEEFLPRVERSARRVEDGEVICIADIDLPFPLRDLHSETHVLNVELPHGAGFDRRWTLRRGNYPRNDGAWMLRPWSGGRTLAVYRVAVDIGRRVPGFVQRLVQKRTASELFGAIRRRAGAPAAR